MPDPPNNFFSKALADGKVFVKTMNLMTQLSKINLEIRAKKKEREKLLYAVGNTIWDIWRIDRTLESSKITNAGLGDLQTIKHLDEEITDLERQAEQTKADFRSAQPGQAAPQNNNPQQQ